jgi:hypothetical protein
MDVVGVENNPALGRDLSDDGISALCVISFHDIG